MASSKIRGEELVVEVRENFHWCRSRRRRLCSQAVNSLTAAGLVDDDVRVVNRSYLRTVPPGEELEVELHENSGGAPTSS